VKSKRSKIMLAAVVFAALFSVQTAQAKIWKNVVNGLTLFDTNFSAERNFLGDGWTINTRAFYNNREFDMGFADLTLNGGVLGTAGFTQRGIPAAQFKLNTGGTPLSYSFNFNNGIQDILAQGQVLIDIDTDINAWGFYDQTFQISNRGSFDADGLGVQDDGTVDFDVGPIVVSGNIYMDILGALTNPFWQAIGTDNPFGKISDRASKAAQYAKISEILQSRLTAGEQLSDQEVATMVNNSILAAMLGRQPSDDLFNDLMVPEGLFDQSDLLAGNSPPEPKFNSVPEPTTLLMLLPALVLLRPRRRNK